MMDLTVKPSRVEQTPGFGDGRKEPIAKAAELAHETAVKLERARHARDHELGPTHPAKRRNW